MIKKLLLLTLLIMIAGYYYVFSNTCRKYRCITFDNIKSFKEVEKIEESNIGYKGMLVRGDIRIYIEAYSASTIQKAEEFDNVKIMQIQGLYENARSPYPGELSNEVVCKERYKPVIKSISLDKRKSILIEGYLNDRLQYGSCLENQIAYKGKTAMIFCENHKKWYLFETIAKKSDLNLDKETDHLIQSLKCQKPFSNIGNIFP